MQPPGGDLYKCTTCGASLSLEQLRGTDCPFCKTVFPHHGRANEQAALVNQIMAQQMAQANPYMYGGQPPQISSQYGAPPPQPMNPYANPYGTPPVNPMGQQWEGALKKSMTWMFVTIGIVFFAMIAVGAIVAFMLMR